MSTYEERRTMTNFTIIHRDRLNLVFFFVFFLIQLVQEEKPVDVQFIRWFKIIY